MSNDITPPIEVSDNTLEGQIATFARYFITSVGAFALGKGWVTNEALQVLTGLVTVGAPMAYGIYKTWTAKTRLITIARSADDSVAVVK